MADKWMICPICDGDGTHVNPAIDAHGLTAEDFAEDPDFMEDYFSGMYDVRCKNCKGSGKVLTAEQEEREAAREDELEDRYTRMRESGIWDPGWQDPHW